MSASGEKRQRTGTCFHHSDTDISWRHFLDDISFDDISFDDISFDDISFDDISFDDISLTTFP